MLTPSTNNGLESINNVIKKENTIRERLPLGKFNTVLMEMVAGWSLRYKNKHIEFQYKPQIDLPLWTKSYQWVRENVLIRSYELIDGIQYTISYSSSDEPKEIPSTFESFNDFKENMFKSIKTFLPTDWMKGECSCQEYMKKYICLHIVGMAIRLKLTKVPVEAKNIQIGEKRKPGRPSKAKKALVVQ